jgi:hypothetical protein
MLGVLAVSAVDVFWSSVSIMILMNESTKVKYAVGTTSDFDITLAVHSCPDSTVCLCCQSHQSQPFIMMPSRTSSLCTSFRLRSLPKYFLPLDGGHPQRALTLHVLAV